MAGCSLNGDTSAKVKTYLFKRQTKNLEAVDHRATEYSDKEVSHDLVLVHLECTPWPNNDLRVLEGK